MLVNEMCSRWIRQRRMAIKPRTIEHYTSLYNHYLVDKDWDTSESETADKISDLIYSVWLEHPRTAQALYIILKSALKRAGIMEDVPRPNYVAPRVTAWTDDQMQSYVKALNGPSYIPLLLMLYAGLRRGEAAGLCWEDIDLEKQMIHITKQKQRINGTVRISEPKTARSTRMIPIPDCISDTIMIYRSTGPIWPYTPEALSAAHRRTCDRANITPCGSHMLRHSYATSISRHGGAITAIQSCLGHAHYNTTADIYAPADLALCQQAVNLIPGPRLPDS